MTRTRWTDDELTDKLNNLIPEYLEIKNLKSGKRIRRAAFFEKLLKDLEKERDYPTPTPEQLEEAKLKAKENMDSIRTKKRKKVQGKDQASATASANVATPTANTATSTANAETSTSTAEPASLISDEEAAKIVRQNMRDKFHDRLSQWFTNHTRPGSKIPLTVGTVGKKDAGATSISTNVAAIAEHDSTRTLLKLGPQRMKHMWQAYWSMERTKLQPVIQEEWDTYCKATPVEERRTWIEFLREAVKERLNNEPEDVKASVDEYRKSHSAFDDPSETQEERNQRYHTALNKLPKTMQHITEGVRAQTGFSSIFMAGGPHPGLDGDFKVYVAVNDDIDESDEPLAFDQWLGPERYRQLQQWFTDFLEDQYGDGEERKKWSSKPSKEKAGGSAQVAPVANSTHSGHEDKPKPPTNDDAPNNDKPKPPTNDDAPKNDRDEESINASDNDSSGSSDSEDDDEAPPAWKKTYLEEREEQIAKNKALLASLFPGKVSELIKGDGSEKTSRGRRKGSKNHKATEEEILNRRASSRTKSGGGQVSGGQSATPNTGSPSLLPSGTGSKDGSPIGIEPVEDGSVPEDSDPSQASGQGEKTDHAKATPTPPSSETPPSAVQSGVPASTETRTDSRVMNGITPGVSNDEANKPANPNHDDASMRDSNDEDPDKNEKNEKHDDAAMGDRPGNSNDDASMDGPADSVAHTSSSGDDDSKTVDSAGAVATSAAPPPPPIDGEHSDDGGSKPKNEANDSKPKDEQSGDIDHTDIAVDLEAPFEELERAWTAVVEASADRRWHGLLSAYLAYEQSNPPHGKLSTASRPEEVQKWIQVKRDKKHIFPSVNSAAYGPRWMAWWRRLQPSWRLIGDNTNSIPTSRVLVDDADWSCLEKGGTAGLWTVVVSLSWWLRALSGGEDVFWLAVDDVSWVLSQLRRDGGAPIEKKWGVDDVPADDRPRKR
ncbi:hypothetical protein DFP72DRAFT_852072 [Ephemerocybe angulata]|uniref:Uncharacterized protein n=1 Tax=Ephemerocybe angulata TaxID=980116 RepID=A0A8H6HN57_9AGAR|nr:hypothetical protein DFP72DRAFT_852072 [Tulosesus angulatus]